MAPFTDQNYDNYEIILILFNKKKSYNFRKIFSDNNIDDSRITIYEYKQNLGYAKGNNIGVDKTNFEYVLISNPDVETNPNFLNQIMESFLKLEKMNKSDRIIVGPRICNYDGIIEFSRRKINFLCFSDSLLSSQ